MESSGYSNNLENAEREAELPEFVKSESLRDARFTVDRSCIPTVSQDEQEKELQDLNIEVYQQEILEKEIIHQVDKAIEIQIQEKSKELSAKNEAKGQKTKSQSEVEKISETQKEDQLFGFNLVSPDETEKERKIRMGEMTPFGTLVSLRTVESNNLGNVEEYLKKQLEISKARMKRSGPVKKETSRSPTKSKSVISKKDTFFPKRRKRREVLGSSTSMNVDDLEKTSGKSLSETTAMETSSGSEYIPGPDSDSDPDFEIGLKTSGRRNAKKMKKISNDEYISSDGEYFDDVYPSKKLKGKKELDDGDEMNYLTRMEEWERHNSREEIETKVRCLEDGFKVPLLLWNKLFNYQKVGVQWLWELNLQRCGGILGDEMGLGKTIQVIVFLASLKVSKIVSRHGSFKGLGPVLIVCPTTVMHQWVKEFHQWWPQFRVALLHDSGTFKGKRKSLIRDIVKSNGILVTSYITCIQQSEELLRYTWHYVILDEGHKIRNPDSQIACTVKLFRTPHRLILSGSPMQNNLKELWSLFDFIFPGKLGTLPVFMAEFSVPITQGGYANASKVQVATAFKCATVLRDTISPYLLRRVKEDVKSHIKLPPKNEQVLFCRLTDEQKELYISYLNSGKVDDMLSGKFKIFVGLIELRKICNHPDLFTGGPKLFKWDKPDLIPEEKKFGYWKKAGKMVVVETLLKMWKKQGHRVLIFTQSRRMLLILEAFLQSQNYEYIKMDGSTSIDSRQPLINKFNDDKKYYIFLATTHVGGLGVNLTGANRVIIYDPDWNPATDVQARERAWRIGQENQVTIYRLVTSGTIEEKIYHRQIFKQFLTNKVLKNPSQRRFFKSNDLYELFTYKDSEGMTETSAIFAGTGYEVNLKKLSHRQKVKKIKEKMNLEKSSMKQELDAKNILTKKKIEKMKELAQNLSRKIATEALAKGNISNGEADKKNEAKAESEILTLQKQKKHKKRKRKDVVFEGEVVPYLKKQAAYRDVLKEAADCDDNDYILKKLFSKSGVHSALQHDQIMDPESADYALVEGEAEKVAKEAVRALKESRKHCMRVFEESQAKSTPKPRFGRKTFGQKPTTDNCDKNSPMTSAELLQRIRQRNGLCPVVSNISNGPVNNHSELLTDIRNFIAFDAKLVNKATTQEIVDRFRDRLPTEQTPLFKALLNEICDFHRTASGEGVWELRSEFCCAFVYEILRNINMANPKDTSQPETSVIDSQVGECQNFWHVKPFLKGPPFYHRDYMISPSESSSAETVEKPVEKKKLTPCDIRIDERYILDSQKSLRKILSLIRDDFAHNFVVRLKELIRIFLNGSPQGFLIEDLPCVIEVIEYFSRNKDSVPEYTEFVRSIIDFTKEPPKIKKASDTLYCKDPLVDYFTLFGELLATFEDECFQIQLLTSLDNLLVRHKLVDINCVKLSSCHEAMEESHLPFALTVLMETVPLQLYFHYLEIALKMILISTKAGYKMIQGNILEHVLWRMEPNDPERFPPEILEKESELCDYYGLIDKSSYILWTLFSFIPKHNSQIPIPGEKALWSLKYLFQREAKKKVQRAVDTRNNIAGILVKLISIFGQKLPLGPTGWLTDISELAVATEIKPKINWTEVHFSSKKEDYLLKQFMLLCICLLTESTDLIETLDRCHVMEGLLRLIIPKTSVPRISSRSTNLLILGFRTLSEIVPRLPGTYIKKKGNIRFLNAIKYFIEQDSDQDTLLEALKAFSRILTCGKKIILEDAKRRGSISLLMNLSFRLLSVTLMKLHHQEKLARVFLSLERMLMNDCKVHAVYSDSCVSLSIKFLQRILANSKNDSKWNPTFLLSFGGFFWETVAWYRSALMSFIEQGGVFLLLDFIEISNFPLQMLFLGALVDMTDEGETIAHLLAWRGKSGFGILSMMIDIWRKEEYFTKVHRTQEGFIKDLDAPLMTEEQWYLTNQYTDGHFYSPSIIEMVCSARPKIHALYQFLMSRYLNKTQVGESAYYLKVTAVKPLQSVYMPLLEHYLALKMGEVWFEVIREANLTGTLPLVFDGEVICTLIEEKNKWAYRIRTIQEEIALTDQSGDLQAEKKCYKFVKSCQLAGALEALSSLEYITRSTFKEFQKQKKQMQIKDLENSLEKFQFTNDFNFHRTFFLNSAFTPSGFNYFLIKSEREASETEVPAPVSPERSEEFLYYK